jgi:hypothetical protein
VERKITPCKKYWLEKDDALLGGTELQKEAEAREEAIYADDFCPPDI